MSLLEALRAKFSGNQDALAAIDAAQTAEELTAVDAAHTAPVSRNVAPDARCVSLRAAFDDQQTAA